MAGTQAAMMTTLTSTLWWTSVSKEIKKGSRLGSWLPCGEVHNAEA